MNDFREIESKFFLKGEEYFDAIDKLTMFLDNEGIHFDTTVGSGKDFFYPKNLNTFIRIREYDGREEAGELTMKCKDKGNITDRLETNIKLKSTEDLNNATAMCEHLYKKADSAIWKRYYIFWTDEHTNIVLYETDKNELPLILEIEAPDQVTLTKLRSLCKQVFDMELVMKSLYELSKE